MMAEQAKRGRGRPKESGTLCNNENIDKLCEALERLGIGKYACIEVGINEGTVNGWLMKAAQGGQYAIFADRWARARVRSRAALVQNIAQAGADDWRASAWLLERYDPEAFPQKPEVQVTTHVHQGAEVAPLLAKLVSAKPERVGNA
jgi:hypothetical protein